MGSGRQARTDTEINTAGKRRQLMDAIPLHRIAIVRPFVEFLAGIGAPVEGGFRQVGLPFAALENVNNYVPSQRFWAFVGNMARSEGIEDLGFRVGDKYGADCADAHCASLLCRSPTLYHALMKASELVRGTTSRSRIGLRFVPHGDQVHFFHQPSFDTHNPFLEQIDWFGLMANLGMVRLFAGPRWQPGEIGLLTDKPPCPHIREQFPDTRIRRSQRYAYIALDSTLLSLPPLSGESTSSSLPVLEAASDEFAASLKQVLRSYVRESDLGIEFAADLCNASRRSVQRRLAATGTRYSEVVDQVRFEAARDMLQQPGMKVTEVGHLLGYSDSAHFTRAFRRVSGITPRQFRQTWAH
jgi:AraC-like DNA-binding protein